MALTKRELIEFLNELTELVEVTQKEKANIIAQKILNEYEHQFGFEEAVVQETSLIYVGSLPEDVQKQIKSEVVSYRFAKKSLPKRENNCKLFSSFLKTKS